MPKSDPEVVTNFPTLGYAQMADGQVVAILPDGDSVRLVRQGEALGDGIRVAEVYQTSIDIAHPPDLEVSSLVARDLNNKAGFAAVHELQDSETPQGPLLLARTALGRSAQHSIIAAMEKSEAKPPPLADLSNDGCPDDEQTPTAALAILESPEDLANSADGDRELSVAEGDQPEAGVAVEQKGLDASHADQFPFPVEIANDLFQRPPPGILPFEDVEASPGHPAPGDGQVRLPDPLSLPSVLEGNSGKAHPGPCSRRKQ